MIAPVRRAALLMEPFSEQTAAALASSRELKRRDAVRTFRPELEAVDDERRPLLEAAIGAAASWSWWDALRTQQGLDPDRAAEVLRGTLRALVLQG
jgi:hypothetical protein